MCFLGVFFFIEAQSAFNELDRRDQEYTKAVLDLETSAVGVLHLDIAVWNNIVHFCLGSHSLNFYIILQQVSFVIK